MGQAQDKFVDEQNDDGSQDPSTVENSVITEATITVVSSESQTHHDNGFLPLSMDSHMKGNGSNSPPNDTDPGGILSEKGKSFTSDGNGHMDFMEKSDNYTIRLTTSTIDFTDNSLASSLASLSVRDPSSSDCMPSASVVQATTVKNNAKEIHYELSKNYEENSNSSVEDVSINTKKNESIRKKTSKEIKSTLADEAEYTIPAAIAEDVLREMLANKPSQDLIEELEPTPVITNGKGENSSSKLTVNHEKNGESSEANKRSVKKNNVLIPSGMTDAPFPSKFTFPNIADKNFFLPNFSNATTTSSPSFPFGNSSELSLQNPFQSPSISSSNAPANYSNSKDQRRATSQWHPPVLDKFSPQLSSKTPIAMPSSSIWPPSISTTSPTDTQFSNSNLLFPQFTGSFKFDMNSKNAVTGSQPSNLPPPLVRPSTPPFTTTPPLSPSAKTSPISSQASAARKGVHSNVGADNANNKKKRKALQTVGGSSTTSSGVGGVIKTSTAKERANPLRRVERRLTQRSTSVMNRAPAGSGSGGDTVSQFDKVFNKETSSMRPPQTTFDFSFKSIPEKSAALAASVNAASAKRLAAVSPIQTMNAKNDPFSSSLFLQQQSPTVTTVSTLGASKKKASTKRAAPSSVAFKSDDIVANHNHIRPQVAVRSKALLPPLPPPPPATPKSSIPRRKIRFTEKSGDWICMFCEYRLYYGDGRRRRRPKANTGSVNGGEGGNNNTGEGGNSLDKALAT
ncbi:16543_t:CDS:2 [Acaulospora colombiana]|uniref:16543_t:CDS:1 n=1 Tax=Acaulospora colombiana TaxID=27376 RepID=A0ACA9KQI8_9GLOM|nr:16543_t:CDS:2 [Acaulospora colombiana]